MTQDSPGLRIALDPHIDHPRLVGYLNLFNELEQRDVQSTRLR